MSAVVTLLLIWLVVRELRKQSLWEVGVGSTVKYRGHYWIVGCDFVLYGRYMRQAGPFTRVRVVVGEKFD